MTGAEHSFQQQHKTLFGLGAQIAQAMNDTASDESVMHLRRLVARFKGALLVHQRMENEALYPRLLDHPDPAIAEQARVLYEDLRGIYDLFAELEQRFGTGAAISAALPDYVSSLRRMLKRLFVRMQREDAELYSLASRANVATHSLVPPPPEDDLDVAAERERWARGLDVGIKKAPR
jgi:hypothetical protein